MSEEKFRREVRQACTVWEEGEVMGLGSVVRKGIKKAVSTGVGAAESLYPPNISRGHRRNMREALNRDRYRAGCPSPPCKARGSSTSRGPK